MYRERRDRLGIPVQLAGVSWQLSECAVCERKTLLYDPTHATTQMQPFRVDSVSTGTYGLFYPLHIACSKMRCAMHEAREGCSSHDKIDESASARSHYAAVT